MKKRSSKQVLEACFQLVEDWASKPDYELSQLLSALKDYDADRFFKSYKNGYEKALKARVAAGKP